MQWDWWLSKGFLEAPRWAQASCWPEKVTFQENEYKDLPYSKWEDFQEKDSSGVFSPLLFPIMSGDPSRGTLAQWQREGMVLVPLSWFSLPHSIPCRRGCRPAPCSRPLPPLLCCALSFTCLWARQHPSSLGSGCKIRQRLQAPAALSWRGCPQVTGYLSILAVTVLLQAGPDPRSQGPWPWR